MLTKFAYADGMFDQCLYFNTTALARVVEREWARAFRPLGVTPPQGFLLRLVLGRPGLSQNEIAEALTITRPTTTRLIDGLERAGLLERRQDPEDARRWSVHPTPRARKLHDALNESSGAVTRRIQDHIGKQRFADTVGRV